MAVSKTALGLQVMKDRSVSLSAQQRSALILCDGKRSADDVVRMTAAVGVTMQDVLALNRLGLVDIIDTLAATAGVAQPVVNTVSQAGASSAAASAPIAPHTQAVPGVTSSSFGVEDGVDFGDALNAAITLCSSLGFKGFGLNMSLTGVDSIEKLQKLAPEIRRAAGDAKYKPLHAVIFGRPL